MKNWQILAFLALVAGGLWWYFSTRPPPCEFGYVAQRVSGREPITHICVPSRPEGGR